VPSLVILVSAVLVFIMQTNRHIHTDRQKSHTDAAKLFTPTTVVGVSNDTSSDNMALS